MASERTNGRRARRRARRIKAPTALLLLVGAGTLTACGVGMLVAAIVGEIGDGRAVVDMAAPGIGFVAIGAFGLWATPTPDETMIRPATGFAAVALAWVAAALAGAVPLLLTGTFTPIDAVFETMSGFSTTGATLIANVEAEPQAILMWRSITQWLGGVGIVLVVVAVAPLAKMGLQRVFYAEATGITTDRLTPRITDTAKIIGGIYLALSLAAAIAYAIAGMSVFDAVNHAMTTLATGGFSTRNASLAAYDSPAIELVAILFMTLAGINFAIYWGVVRGNRARINLAETVAYLSILAVAIIAVSTSVELAGDSTSLGRAIRDGGFSVVSLMTTTGFTTADFDLWNTSARIALLALMVIGASAGSTAGGMKVIRVVLLGKITWQELQRQIKPTKVQVLRLGRRTFSEDVRRGLLGYMLIYSIVFALGTVAFAVGGLGPTSSFSATAATLNNIGPGLGDVGALENFSALPDSGRIVAIVLMLAGRLEIFTVFALFAALAGAFRRR